MNNKIQKTIQAFIYSSQRHYSFIFLKPVSIVLKDILKSNKSKRVSHSMLGLDRGKLSAEVTVDIWRDTPGDTLQRK